MNDNPYREAVALLDQRAYENAIGEIDRLRAALAEAVSIANGSGADFTWQARERLRHLRDIADGRH